MITKTRQFHETVKIGLEHAQDGKIVTFGITPTAPETGYGYLKLSNNVIDDYGTSELLGFVEKPDQEQAGKNVNVWRFSLNAGIFLSQQNI